MLGLKMKRGHFFCRQCHMGNSGFQMAIYAVLRDQCFDQIFCIFCQMPELVGVMGAHHPFEFALINVLAAAQLPAIAPRRAKANTLRLKYHDVIAAFGQSKRRRQTSISSPNDADISANVCVQGGKGGQR